jgi:hypothetical protein
VAAEARRVGAQLEGYPRMALVDSLQYVEQLPDGPGHNLLIHPYLFLALGLVASWAIVGRELQAQPDLANVFRTGTLLPPLQNEMAEGVDVVLMKDEPPEVGSLEEVIPLPADAGVERLRHTFRLPLKTSHNEVVVKAAFEIPYML